MALSLNKPKLDNLAGDIWKSAERLRGKFKAYEYQGGTLDSVIIHAREVYRSAIIAAAHSIALVHNHPSGNPEPSEADLRITKDIARAGQLLKIELLDHIVIGHASHASLREMGYLSR